MMKVKMVPRRNLLAMASASALIASLCGCAANSGGATPTAATTAIATTAAPPTTARVRVARRGVSRTPSRRAAPSATLGRRTKTSGCRVEGQLPDPACTPGGVFPNATVAEICRSGYAQRVRSVLPSTKDAVYASYAITTRFAREFEIDHLVPLEVGGNNTRANLWPQITPGYGEKDAVENELHDAVCAGRIALKTAQAAIAHDWRHAGVPVPSPPRSPAPAQSHAPPSATSTPPGFCLTHRCIASFSTGRGTVVQCADGQYSHSGGLPGVCSRHGGVG